MARRFLSALLLIAVFAAMPVGHAAAEDVGSEANPVPLGQSVKVSESWTLAVDQVWNDPTLIQPSEQWFLDWLSANPSPEGEQIFAIQATIASVGSKAGFPLQDLFLKVISDTGFEYSDSCGTTPGGLHYDTQLDVGESLTAVFCWTVRMNHIPTLKLKVEDFESFSGDGTWFSLSTAAVGTPRVGTPTASAVATIDPALQTCDGLGDYRKAMFEAGRHYLKAVSDDGIDIDANPMTLSSDDWQALAEDELQYQREIRDVTPPEWAKTWHDLKVQYAGFVQQLDLTAATSGIIAASAMVDELNKLDAQADQAIAAIAQICSEFPAFEHDFDSLDGNIDGTAVPTPTD